MKGYNTTALNPGKGLNPKRHLIQNLFSCAAQDAARGELAALERVRQAEAAITHAQAEHAKQVQEANEALAGKKEKLRMSKYACLALHRTITSYLIPIAELAWL